MRQMAGIGMQPVCILIPAIFRLWKKIFCKNMLLWNNIFHKVISKRIGKTLQ